MRRPLLDTFMKLIRLKDISPRVPTDISVWKWKMISMRLPSLGSTEKLVGIYQVAKRTSSEQDTVCQETDPRDCECSIGN